MSGVFKFMYKQKEEESCKEIKINTLFNPLSEGDKYQTTPNEENIIEEELLRYKNKQEKKEKEKDYNFKERIIYNNIPSDYIPQTKSDSTNTYYFEKFFELKEDFDHSNYANLINMRTKYLSTLFKKDKKEKKSKSFDLKEENLKEKEENEIKEENEKNEENEKKEEKEKEKNEKEKEEEIKEDKKEGDKKEDKKEGEKKEEKKEDEIKEEKKETTFDEDEFKSKDTLYSLIADLADMMNYQQDQGDEFLHYSILERIFSNLFFEIENFFDENDLNKHAVYEAKLCECIDLFEKNFITKGENINNKSIHFLYQFQKISMLLKSCGAFIKILELMKSKNIVFDNYNSIYKKNFKFDLLDSIEKIKKENDKNKLFEIPTLNEVTNYEFCTDEKYLYLCYDSTIKNHFKLEKYCLTTGEKKIEKEIENNLSYSILNDYKNDKLDILIFKQKNEFELLIINKNDFEIEKKYLINSPIERAEFYQIITSSSFFFLSSVKQIYILNFSDPNKPPVFNTFIVLNKLFKIDKSYFFIWDDYIKFSCKNVINLTQKSLINIPFEEISKSNERNYCDNFNSIFYNLRYIKGKNKIEVNSTSLVNFKFSNINSNKEIKVINKEIEACLSFLTKNYPVEDTKEEKKEDRKIDPFKHYLEYTNNLESLLNFDEKSITENDKIKFKVDKELSKNYYSFLFSALIKYFYYYCLKNESEIQSLIFNINNDIMFDITKKLLKEKKEHIILYIYVHFLIQNGKNKNEKLDEKVNWIVKFCLGQDQLSLYLFDILNEIYKYEPKYIHSTNIAKDIISSKKLSFEEQICFFSLIDLKEKKEIFIELLEKFLSIEKIIILSNEANISYPKKLYNNICKNFISYFRDPKIYEFKKEGFWKEFSKILEIFIKCYNSILTEIIKPENKNKRNNMIIRNSAVCQILFLLINILLFKIDKLTNKNLQIDFIKLFLKTLILSGNYNEVTNIEHNIEKEEIIIYQYKCSSENQEEINDNLSILTGKAYLEYDLETNYPYKLTIGKLPLIKGYPTDIGQIDLSQGKNLSAISINSSLDKNIKNNNYKRFRIKLSNFKNDESNTNILVDIRRSILFFILKSAKNICQIRKEKNEDQKDDENKEILNEKINKIIKSQFFKDISIISKKNKIIKEQKYFDFKINEVLDNKISEEYENNYARKIQSIFEDKEEEEKENNNIININPNISSIIENLIKNGSNKKLISVIHQEFIKKNPWGSINENLLKNIIIKIFGIILYEYNLFNEFEEIAILNNKNKLSQENNKLKMFISIYSKINLIRKLVSKKKQEISVLKDIQKKDEEELMNKYISEINNKIIFIMDNKKRKDEQDNNKDNKEEENLENIEKTVSFLIDYLADDMINESSIKTAMEKLNENLINKERNLNYLNKLLYISGKTQDIKDLISCMNYIIKNGEISFYDFDMELSGTDNSLIDKYKKQVFIYLLQIINKLKNSDKNNYDISYYFTLINSLYCPFTKDDYKFIEISKLYDIFNCQNTKNKFNNLLLSHNSRNFTKINDDDIKCFRISYDSLYKESFNLFKLMIFLAINQFNDNQQNPLLKTIFDFIIKIFENYIEEMDDFKNKRIKINNITNEEKLNSFLILFYRCILKNNIRDIIKKNYNKIIPILFNILICSSTKNKIISLKIIELLFINDTKEDESSVKNIGESFKKELKEKNLLLYNFIYLDKINHIDNAFIEFLFNFSLILQQKIDNIIKFINGTENNMALSLIIIKMIQNKLSKKDNSSISNNIIKFIETNYLNPKYLSIILQILGVDLNYQYISSFIELEKNKKGIILCFSNIPIKNEPFTNFSNINYSKGEYIYYINEDNIFKNFLTNLDITIESATLNNIKIIMNNVPILPFEKNKLISDNLIENISKYEEKDIYFILRYIKILLLEENIKLNNKIISYIMEKSLNKEILNFKCKIVTLEKLEKMMIPYICESNPSVFLEKTEKKNEEINTESEIGEPLKVDEFQPDIFLDDISLFYRCYEDHSLGFNFNYSKIFNFDLFNKPKKFLKIFDNQENAKKYQENCILMTKDLLTIEKISSNIKYIIIPDSFNEEQMVNNKIKTVPIIMIESLTFNNICNHTFYDQPFDEFGELTAFTFGFDISSLIEIPDEKIIEFFENQRDILVEVIKEEPNYEAKVNNENEEENNEEEQMNEPNYEEFKNILCGNTINKIDKKLIINKLISLICRRLAIIVKMTQKIKIPNDDLKKLVKLLLYENLTENSKEAEIFQIIKNFVLITSFDDDIETIKCFTDISFLDCKDILSDNQAKDIQTEFELLKYENLNNDMFLVDWFFVCQHANNKTNILDYQFVIDYLAKLIKQNSMETVTFILRVFKHIERNINSFIKIIEKDKNTFCSKELIQLFDSCEKILQEHLNIEGDNFDFNQNFYEKIELFFVFFNIAYKLKVNYNIDLDTNYYENSLLLSIYKIVSLLIYINDDIKSDANYSNFVELCYQKGIYKYLLDYNQFSKPLKTIKFNYYDKSFNSNFVMNFQNLIPKNLENSINSLSLILRGVDDKLINPDNCVFIYESEKCNHLQDYVKKFDRPNDKRILLLKDNFTISYPYKNFFSYLYGAGYNDKNSLGIQIGNKVKFSVPQPCVGLEECKNIIDFKFGYYHTFVQTADGDLLTCGTDKGSSFRCSTEFPFFNKQTYFYSLSKENEGIKTIAANNYNSSILLTNNNKLFCCGKNNTCCLGNSIEGDGEIDKPVEMPEFLPVIKELKPPYIVKEIACGYKSTLFLLEAGYAFTCGSQDFSQCGSKEKVPNYREYFPLYPPRGTKFTHVVAGEEFFLFLVEEINDKGYGKLYSLGQNEFGRSGAGELNLNYTLQRLEEVEDKNFVVISSRNENAAAISTEGELYTFGNNSLFALGLGNSKNVFVPTKVEALKDYICDNVGISQHHMVVIARRKETGKKVVLSCGDNQYRAICQDIENDNAKVKVPTEIKFFLEKRPDEEPIRASLSRYQTYLLSLKVDLRDKINKILNEFKCSKCQKDNQYCIFFNIDENKKINYYCKNCAIEDNKKIFYVLNTIDDDTKDNLEKIINDKEKISELCLSFEENQKDMICLHCNKKIIVNVYQSFSNDKLILCENCYMSKCPLIEYPQLFINYNNDLIPKKKEKKINFDSILYPNIIKSDKPYLEFDVIPNYKKEYIIKELYKNKQINDLYNNTFKLINKNILKEMRKFKEFYEASKFNYIIEQKDDEENKKEEGNKKEEEKEKINKIIEDKKTEDKKEEEKKEEANKIIEEKNTEDKKEEDKKDNDKEKDKKKAERKIEYKNYEFLANIAGKSNKYLIYEIIKKLIEQRNKTDITNQDFKNLDLYKNNNKLYNLSFELSNRINNQIFKILDLSIKFQFPTIFRKVIENSLELISSQERKEIFQRNILMKRTNVRAEDLEITISRIKSNLFYAKNELDKDGVYTVFSQLFRKTRNYEKKNYLSYQNNRLFSVRLQGEGASDFSGVYNEIISIISFELQSKYLDLFIKTPNNENEIGQNRDKYMPNPLAKSHLNKEMYYFIGNLMLHAISSGNVLDLNLHPIFYKKILKQNVSFKDIETVDKLSYKFITSLESIKDEKEFQEKHSDLFFAVHSSSDNSLIDLVKEGQSKKVTFENLPEYIKLYKEFLITEIDEQVSNIRKGIFDILDENLSSLLTPQDLEEYICGAPVINLQLLREKTRYHDYESDSPTIINFWKALESFSEEEKSKYLRFVSGRCKLPDPRNIIIDHKISLYRSKNPDKRMPTSQTCYFTLNLPNYSSYEILREKLRYVINNCSSIDADFFPEDGGDAFNEE